MKRLLLASTSPYRRALLERLGVPFDVEAPEVDESAWRHLPPREMALHLAEAKARAITRPGRLVIGSDQVAEVDGDVLGKPGTEERAVEQLLRLSGRAHRLITAVAVHDTDTHRVQVALDVHVLHMRPLGREALARYVAHDQPLGCAGAYMLERRGVALFDRVEADPDTADDTAIVGLPLTKLCRLLRGFGFDVLAP